MTEGIVLFRFIRSFQMKLLQIFLKVKLGTQFISPSENEFLNVFKICKETLNKFEDENGRQQGDIKARLSIKKFLKLLYDGHEGSSFNLFSNFKNLLEHFQHCAKKEVFH